MRAVHQRIFIAIDEWVGILILIHLHTASSTLFWPFGVTWAVAVYVISYPWYWGWWQLLLAKWRARRLLLVR